MSHPAQGAAALVIRSRATVAYSLIAAAVAASLGAPAFGQSAGTVATEEELAEVVVSARRDNILGTMTDLNATKTRVAITAEYLESQMAGQSVIQNLNQLPGVNFTNNDPYGASGGNLRLRGFEGSRVNVTFDGLPLNDTGNYALFTGQLLDPELIDRVEVNLGTTDVDSPTASATGGTISFRSVAPSEEPGGMVVASGGENSFRRLLAKYDTGAFGPWGTKAWIAASTTSYEKFKGPGELDKRQFNAFLRQEVGDNGSFINVGVHWNRNRNAFYRQATAAAFRQFGFGYDNLATCTRDLPTAGVADNDNATTVAGTPALPANDNLANTASCTNYFGLRINPSDTGNIRVQSLWNLRDNLRFTFEPSIQYTLANGGGTTVLRETPLPTDADRRVVGSTSLAGLDLNGDGDILDQVRFYTPNITHTQRWGLNSSLIWDINDNNRVRFAYTLDYGKHRQSAAWGNIDNFGNPVNVFAGRLGPKVATADGSFLRGRDRYSIASMNQISAEWRGQYLDDKLVATLGLRAPQFERQLNQNCFSLNGGNGNSGQLLCTTQPVTRRLPNGNVQFSGSTLEYIPPYEEDIKFDEILPNLGVTYRLTDSQTVYASYAEGLSAPRTDNLYPVRRLASGAIGRGIPESELTKAYDIGWRWNSNDVLASVALWRVDYDNRIVSSFDADLGFSVDRNLGRVDLQGIDMQAGWRVAQFLTLSGAASYNDSEIKQNVPLTATTFLATQGKKLVETPDWTYSLRADFRFGEGFAAGLQGKYVGERAATDINDEFAPSYTVVDLDVGYTLEVSDGMSLEAQLNVLNLLDEEYFGSISSGTGLTLNNPAQYQVAAPRTAMLSLKLTF
jgi:iron complex outermembrane receptor protein